MIAASIIGRPSWRATQPLRAGSTEMLVEEGKDFVPAVDRLFGAVVRAVMREECVTGPVIAVELVVLAQPLEFSLGAVDLVGCGIGVLIAEETQKWAIDPFGQIHRCHRLRLGQPRLVVDDDIAAPAIHRTLNQMGERTGDEISLPAARAEADHPDLAAGMW